MPFEFTEVNATFRLCPIGGAHDRHPLYAVEQTRRRVGGQLRSSSRSPSPPRMKVPEDVLVPLGWRQAGRRPCPPRALITDAAAHEPLSAPPRSVWPHPPLPLAQAPAASLDG